MIFENYDRIVFAGDSVTDMGSANPVGEGLFDNVGRGYVRVLESMFATYYPEIFLRITNSGVSGNTSRDLLSRFDRDVVELNPDWVSICIGINDVWRQFDSPAILDGHVLPEEYEAKYKGLTQEIIELLINSDNSTPYDITPYGYLLTQFSYYFRCKIIHGDKPYALFSFADESEIKCLKCINELLDEFIENNLHSWFNKATLNYLNEKAAKMN